MPNTINFRHIVTGSAHRRMHAGGALEAGGALQLCSPHIPRINLYGSAASQPSPLARPLTSSATAPLLKCAHKQNLACIYSTPARSTLLAVRNCQKLPETPIETYSISGGMIFLPVCFFFVFVFWKLPFVHR